MRPRAVSRETEQRLARYEALFRLWNRRINLASNSTLDDFRNRHIGDSLQLLDLAESGRRWLDLGSGGGLPGIPLGIALAEQEGAHVHLVESNRKKSAFLLNCVTQCEAKASVHSIRVEEAASRIFDVEYVCARALAPLPMLLELAAPWLEAGAVGLFHKGRGHEAELVEARKLFAFDLTVHESAIDPESAILRIQKPVRL